MGTKSRETIYGASIRAAAERAVEARKEADRLAVEAWNKRMLGFQGPAQPSPTLGDALNAGYGYLEVRCLGCDTHQTVALDIVRRPKATPVHELERYMRCRDCSQVRGYPYKRSHLVALRPTKITASDPPSTVAGRTVNTPMGDRVINIKQELEMIGAAYTQSFNRQDAAGIAALYAADGVHVGPAGPRKDIEQFYQPIFNAGFNHQVSNIDEAWLAGPDVALAVGQYRISGKDQNNALIERGGYWTGTYVREDGQWRIHLQTAIPK